MKEMENASDRRRIAKECIRKAYVEPNMVAKNAAGFWMVSDDLLIIAVAGSDSREDWEQNIRTGKTPPLPGIGRIHRGFDQHARQIFPAVLNMAKPSKRKLLLCGHSLGGAVALWLALELERREIPVWEVMTFEAPRLGDRTNADLIDTAQFRFERHVMSWELVRFLPVIGYRHARRGLMFCCTGGKIKADPSFLVRLADWVATPALGAWRSAKAFVMTPIRRHSLASRRR